MLAQRYEDLEKCLQGQLKDLDMSHNGAELKSKCTVDSKADHLSRSCDNIPAVMDECEEETRVSRSQNEGEG